MTVSPLAFKAEALSLKLSSRGNVTGWPVAASAKDSAGPHSSPE